MTNPNDPWRALASAVEQGRRYAERANHFQERAEAAEARLDRVSALLDQVQQVQGYQVIAVDRVRRALREETP